MTGEDSSPSPFVPERRRRRVYYDEENYPLVVLPYAVLLDSTTRWILTRSGLHSGPMLVVADSSGIIPEFESLEAARAYASRFLPAPDPLSANIEGMFASAEVPEVDFDATVRWAAAPRERGVGPIELVEAWELLNAADALIELPPFNPMGLMAAYDRIGGREADSSAEGLLLAGMKLSGAVNEIRRSNPDARRAPWPPALLQSLEPGFTYWTDADDALVARALTTAIGVFSAHLSADAATRDVTRSWESPRAG